MFKSILFLSLFVWIGNLSGAPTSVPLKPKPNISRPFPIVGYIERAGKIITLKAGPKGTLYSVETKKGKKLVENLSDSQLLAKDPNLYRLIKKAMAGSDTGFIDASIGRKPLDP